MPEDMSEYQCTIVPNIELPPVVAEDPPPAPSSEPEPEDPPEPEPEPETHRCCRCERIVHDDEHELVRVSGDLWCDNCRDQHATTCDECEELVSLDQVEEIYTSANFRMVFCPECAPSSFTCDGCDRRMADDLYDGDGYCTTCRSPGRPGYLLDYSSDPRMDFYGEGPIFYGIELEVVSSVSISASVGAVAREIGIKGICKEDGSLPDDGFEICMSPMDLEYHRKFWPNLLKRKLPIRAWNHSSCGMHVHISKEPIPRIAIAKMLRFVGCPKNMLFLNTIFGRPENSYCSRVESRFEFDCSSHHYALSTNSEDTIEMRGFKASVNPRAIISAVEFCDALVAFSSPEFRGLKGAEGYEAMVKFVLCRASRWPFLASLFKVGREFIRNRDMTVESALSAEGTHVLRATGGCMPGEPQQTEDPV